ncbi:hypothetical protein [Pedococcus sp.]|uniref:hypothetical protein n=1 Tax=Pedococcus sp. TaxID=2860345 RepID=UPI002E0D6113|nr:hypothetical protein [Pedococcus sp.]
MTDQPVDHQPADEDQPSENADEPQQQRTSLGEHATGDIIIDAALQDLQNAPRDDLDRQLEAGAAVHATLQGRLADLGGA